MGNFKIKYKEGESVVSNIKYLREYSNDGRRKCLFKCHCGVDFIAVLNLIRSGQQKSCGCSRVGKHSGHEGYSLGREVRNGLILIGHINLGQKGTLKSLFRCVCGNEFTSRFTRVKSGDIGSCGCASNIDLDLSTKLRSRWSGIKSRCYNKKLSSYKHYGGRGIRMQSDWINDSAKFINDLNERIGSPPSDSHTLDRKDVDGDYVIDNLRWATWSVQNTNKRPIKLSVEDVLEIRKNLSKGIKTKELSVKYGVSQCTISNIKARRIWKHV